MMLKKTAFIVCTLLCITLSSQSFAQSTTFKSGTAIIDMGSATPTVKNSLKPYGLIYALLKNNHVPVSYVVNANKVKDGIDFVYNGKSYKGGTFVISADYISSDVKTVLNNWNNQGVVIDYATSDFTVNVTSRINFVPKWVMDKANGVIAVSFLTAAGIPSSAYSFKNPSQLNSCDDIFVLPHADPTWATHKTLFEWNRDFKGNIWAGCHAVSVLENLFDPITPTDKMNFLTTNGLIPFTDHNPTAKPFANLLPGDPVAQYLNKTEDAQTGGSETVYLPKIGSAWNAGAKIITSSPNQVDVPANSPGAAVENVYGRAFDDAARGYVAYQASHNIGGSSPDEIAAQRIFFNFSLFALSDKIPPIITANLNGQPDLLPAGTTSGALNATATGSGTGFTYQWSASVAGTFSNPTSAITTFTPSSSITTATSCVLTCVVTEACGRVSFESKKITIIPPSGIHTLTNVDITKAIADGCTTSSVTFNVFTGNPDPDAGARTLLSVSGLSGGTVLTSTNGDVTFTTSDPNFKGTISGTYIVTNGISNSPSANIYINIGDPTLAPVLTSDALTALVDQQTVVNVLGNDLNKAGAADGGQLYIKDIIGKPTKGYVYINTNGTLTYLSNKDETNVAGGDSFQYLACNTTGYCSVGTVTVTLVQDACTAGNYQATTTGTTVALEGATALDALADNYIVSNATTTNNGSATTIILNGFSTAVRKPLLKFDLAAAGIPTNATITSAVLSITTTASLALAANGSNSPFPATIYGVIKPWSETLSTWQVYSTGNVWQTPGASTGVANTAAATPTGDFIDLTQNTPAGTNPQMISPVALGTSIGAGTVIGTQDIKAIVQNWINNENNGLIIAPSGATATGSLTFASLNNSTAANRPKLNIRYTTPPPCLTIPTNYAPIVYPDAAVTSSALSVTISPLLNDKNFYGNANTIQSVSVPAHGTASTNGATVVYTPNGSFLGVDTLTYTVVDGALTNKATIFVTVTRVGPSILNDISSTASNTAKTIVVGANDTDPQGAIGAPVIVSNASNGTLTVVGNDIVYTPSTNFVGTDVFTYRRFGTVADACTTPLSGTATVTVTVTNQAPVANNATINTFACVTGVVKIATIASDPEAGVLSATISVGPSHGSAIANADGTISYVPVTSYVGADVFTYTVTDALGLTSAGGTITVSVSGAANPNTAPVAVNDTDNTLKDQVLYTNVLINDSDANSDPLTISILTAGLTSPANGTITLMPNKLIKYTPNAGFVGTDTYQYLLTDSHPSCAGSGALTSVGTVNITVKAIPTLLSGTVINDVNASAAGTFTNISTTGETGTNGNGSIYIYLTNTSNVIIDKAAVDIDGTYQLSDVPSGATGLQLYLSSIDLAIGASLSTGSVPNGYVNSTPLTRTLPLTVLPDMSPYDWGIYLNATLNAGVIAGGATLCGTSGTVPAITATSNATGGSVTATGYVYQWQSATAGVGGPFTDILNANSTTYSPGTITTTTYYRRKVSTNVDPAVFSNVITATLTPNPSVGVTPTSVTISSGMTQTLTANGAATYSWSPTTNLSASNTAVVIASPITTTAYTVSGTLSGCTATATATITVVATGTLVPGTIGSPQTICALATPGAFTSTAASGGTGTINYQWQSSTDNITFTNIASATSATYGAGALSATTYYRRGASTSFDPVVYTPSVKVNVLQKPVISGGVNGVCAMPRDSIKTFSVTPAVNATRYVWTVPATGGWSGTSTTNTINVKGGTTNGAISVTPFNLSCAGAPVTYNIAIIDYTTVTITGTPVTASGNGVTPITVKIQLIDVLGNLIGCSGGPATLCTSSGTFTSVIDNGDGTYTSYLISSANNVTICGSVAGVPISKTTNVTFTGPQGGIKSNGPIFDFEVPKVTFTATVGVGPYTVIYHSDKSPAGKNDTLRNVVSGTAYPVALIPSTTLYKLVSVIDATGERRDNNFIRDTTTTRVVIPKVIITLKADPAKKEIDSTWATRIVVHTKNIGDLDLTNSQARLNLRDVFPNPVTYVLDSVKVSGATVVPNRGYDGVNSQDLFARIHKKKHDVYTVSPITGLGEMAPDGGGTMELWNSTGNNAEDDSELQVIDDGHSVYMFGALSALPVGAEATIILWLHVKPNGYTEPFVMQAVALGTGHTEDATSLTTSLSNDNDNVNEHPEVTKKGDPLPAVINLFPTASIGASLTAGTPVLQLDGTYNVLLSYKLKNYGNVNLRDVKLTQDLLTSSIGAPSTFNVVGPVTTTGGLIANPLFNAKTDINMLSIDNILGYKQESTLSYTINITPNQLASIYRLQAIASGFSDDLNTTVTDLSTDGTEPDPDGNNIPSEKIITTILINLSIPPVVPGSIGIKTGPTTTVLANGYCSSAAGVEIVPTTTNSGGLDAYLYQWQNSADNIVFKDVVGAENANYITPQIDNSFYLRRATISGSQVKYSNSVYIQVYPTPPTPVITGTGSMIAGKGNITLTSSAASSYLWSNGATTRSIVVTDPGNYTVTVANAIGCTAVASAYAITSLDQGKVVDIQKILTQAPTLQQDGSFLITFNMVAANLRPEALDSVRIKDDLSKVFPSGTTFSVVDIKSSGGLLANGSYDGKTQLELLKDVSKLPGSKKDSVQITIKVFPNGFSGTLNNVATLTARSPLGFVTSSSNDPINNSDPSVRLPTKFTLPFVDIFIPSGFSPNHDGFNDFFVIARPFNTTIRMEIYNRWSNLVYKSLDYKNEWDGKGNQANRIMGEDLPDGTYYYEILATNQSTGVVRKFSGFITLKR